MYRKPHKRLGCNGIKEIKEHSWFKNINWEELLNKQMKSPFVPKDGDNFDKRYCEGVEHVDTQTKERYQYYKSKSKFKTLFLNYTFIREEDKQEYDNNINNNLSSINNNNFSNFNNLSNSRSTTNIHSFSLLNNKASKNKIINKYLNQFDKENNDNNSLNMIYDENDDESQNQKIFKKAFKIPKKNNSMNENYFSDINNNLLSNQKEENYNHLNYFKEKIKENNQGRSSSTLNKRQSEFYSINEDKLNSKIKNDNNNQYYNYENYNDKNITSKKININAPISLNKYKYNRSSSQKNIFHDIIEKKNKTEKIITNNKKKLKIKNIIK